MVNLKKKVRWRLLVSTSHHKTLPVQIPWAFYTRLKLSSMPQGQQATAPCSCLKVRNPARHQGSPHSPREGWVPPERGLGSLRRVSKAGGCFPYEVLWWHRDLRPTEHPAPMHGWTLPTFRSKLRIDFVTHQRHNKEFGRTNAQIDDSNGDSGRQTKAQTLHSQAAAPKGRLFWIAHHVIGVERVACTNFQC